MPLFSPFTATRYDTSKVQLPRVVSPPYDVINEHEQRELYAQDPHNYVRLILNEAPDPYKSAAELLRSWKAEGVLKTEASPRLFVYQQIFDHDGKEYVREGVIGALRLHPYSDHVVLPHERTHKAAKEDRYHLMEATRCNLSPIFGVIEDETRYFDQLIELVKVKSPQADFALHSPDGDVRHTLWGTSEPGFAERIQRVLEQREVVIADGHHRYETALQFSRDNPDLIGADRMLCFIGNLQADGMLILPTHRVLYEIGDFDQLRVLEQLRQRFKLTLYERKDEALSALERDRTAVTLLQFQTAPEYVLLSQIAPHQEPPKLPVAVLESDVLLAALGFTQERIDSKVGMCFIHRPDELSELADDWQLVAYLRPVRPSELMEVVRRGEFMPQKSTFFYPKLLSGLVMREFEAQSE